MCLKMLKRSDLPELLLPGEFARWYQFQNITAGDSVAYSAEAIRTVLPTTYPSLFTKDS